MSVTLDRAGEDVRTWSGYRAHRIAKSTGTLVVLVNADDAGLGNDGTEPWYLICDAHGSLLSDTNRRRLSGHMGSPEDWCDECRNHQNLAARVADLTKRDGILRYTNPTRRVTGYGAAGVEYVCAVCNAKYDDEDDARQCAVRDHARKAGLIS
jgi:hypothetical protein